MKIKTLPDHTARVCLTLVFLMLRERGFIFRLWRNTYHLWGSASRLPSQPQVTVTDTDVGFLASSMMLLVPQSASGL